MVPDTVNDELPLATMSEVDGVRYLHLGTPHWQGAMRISKPHALEFDYIKIMMAWMLFRDPARVTEGHSVQFGLGAGSLTRYCHRDLRMKTTAVELNPSVIAACRKWFHLPEDDDRLNVINGDAAVFAADPAHHGTVDVLNVDVSDQDIVGPVLDDVPFYRHCHALLAEGGVMSVNLFSMIQGRNESSASRIAEAFGHDALNIFSPAAEGNMIVVVCKALVNLGPDELAQRAENIEASFELPARRWLDLLHPRSVVPSNVVM